MARIVSFGWTYQALLARRKTVTRRDWKNNYAQLFKAGDIVQAYDRNPRVGGRPIATLRLTADPYLERGCDMPDEDWEAEGFAYLWAQGLRVKDWWPSHLWREMKAADGDIWVIRFEVVSIP